MLWHRSAIPFGNVTLSSRRFTNKQELSARLLDTILVTKMPTQRRNVPPYKKCWTAEFIKACESLRVSGTQAGIPIA